MAKRPQPMSLIVEGKFESFAPIQRDFNVTLENKTSSTITSGLVCAQWADPSKPAEKWIPESGSASHAFGPSPGTIVIYVESEDSSWAAVAAVDGYTALTINLLEKE